MIQTRSLNHLDGLDVEYVKYNYTGQPTGRLTEHTLYNNTTTELYGYSYDHAGRLLKTTHKLDNNPEMVLAENTYDEFGRLKTTKAANLAALETTRSYTIRSWTKTISNEHYTQLMGYALNGNVNEMEWKQNGDESERKYDFVYDGLSRLTKANTVKGENFSTSYSYDKHGNMLTLTRQGLTPTRAQGLVDNLTLTYTGNQLKKVSDQITNVGLAGSMDFKDYADEEIEYSFNMNGAMTQDLNKGITSIAYNYLNLPQEMLINASSSEAKTQYTYSAMGQKLSVLYKWNSERQITPLTGSNLKAITGTVPDENSMDKDLTLDYVGNFIYENDSLKRILVEGGYIEDGNYYFYITDHLGNNRIVANASGDVVQSNEYYPFGLLMATSTEADKQPYKYGSKELDSYNGLNWYDFEARYFDGVRFTTPDPLSEKYYSISPYVYVANNPLRYVDPTGESYTDYRNDKGELLYRTNDGLKDVIIVADGKIPELKNKLNNFEEKGIINDPKINKEELHTLGVSIEKFSDVAKSVGHPSADVGMARGYKEGYENIEIPWYTKLWRFIAASEEQNAILESAAIRGKNLGEKDRKSNKIDRLNPFRSLKDNKPLIKIKKKDEK